MVSYSGQGIQVNGHENVNDNKTVRGVVRPDWCTVRVTAGVDKENFLLRGQSSLWSSRSRAISRSREKGEIRVRFWRNCSVCTISSFHFRSLSLSFLTYKETIDSWRTTEDYLNSIHETTVQCLLYSKGLLISRIIIFFTLTGAHSKNKSYLGVNQIIFISPVC